jgi:hypothetical protein
LFESREHTPACQCFFQMTDVTIDDRSGTLHIRVNRALADMIRRHLAPCGPANDNEVAGFLLDLPLHRAARLERLATAAPDLAAGLLARWAP